MNYLAIFAGLMLAMSVGMATVSPAPVGGVVKFQYSDGTMGPAMDQTVTLKNMRSMEVVTTQTSSAGEFLVDWANTVQKYQFGDIVSISVLGVTRSVQLPDADLTFININSQCPVTPCPACPDCQACPEQVACDSCCSDCPICPTSSPIDNDWTNFLAGGISILAICLGSAAIFFKAKKGRLQVYKQYLKKDGTLGWKWVTVTRTKWLHLVKDEVF